MTPRKSDWCTKLNFKLDKEHKATLLNFAGLFLMMICMIATVGAMQWGVDTMHSPYTFVVSDKYYFNSGFTSGYAIEDMNITTHTRAINKVEWDKMIIGNTYRCTPQKVSMFDMNPHHLSETCVPV